MNEKQVLHLWESKQEKLDYSELAKRFKQFSNDGILSHYLGIMQRSKLIRSEMGSHSLTSEGWETRNKVPRPPVTEHSSNDDHITSYSDGIVENISDKDLCSNVVMSSMQTTSYRQNIQFDEESPWTLFRRLVGYYLDCVHCDERPSNVLGADQLNDSYVPIMTHGRWWPNKNIDQDVRLKIPVRDGQHAFIRRVLLNKEDFFVGYPFHFFKGKNSLFLIPIFCVPVEKIKYVKDVLEVSLNFDNADINASWLDKRFKTNDERRAFLQHCGLVDQIDDEFTTTDSENITLPDKLKLDLPTAICALEIFCKEYLQESLSPMVTNPVVSFDNHHTGIYNSSVLFAGKQLRFTVGLLKELRKIERASDQDLNKTALKHIFISSENPNGAINKGNTLDNSKDESVPVIPFVPFNYEQEESLAAALSNDLTVITGPPGTGKSQVVVNLLANLAIRDKTALFASKNHKAIDAVIPRTNKLVETGNLITRLKNPETGDEFTWRNAITSIMAATVLPYDSSCDEIRSNVITKLNRRGRMMEEAELWSSAERKLSELNDQLEEYSYKLTPFHREAALSGEHLVSSKLIKSLEKAASSIPLNGETIGNKIRKFIWLLFRKSQLVKLLVSIDESLIHYQLEFDTTESFIDKKERLLSVCCTLSNINTIHQIGRKISLAEKVAKDVKPLSASIEEIVELHQSVSSITDELLNKTVKNRFTGLVTDDLQEMQQMKGIINNMNAAGVGPQSRINWERFFNNSFSKLLRFFPMWAVPNLSVRHGMPLIPAVVDTLIIDEASQCDIVSIIPLLYRAKSVVVVGDIQQLKPVRRMSKSVNMQLMRRHNLMGEKNIFSYSYLDSSCFELAASSPNCGEKVQLKDHYRCHPEIATYFNDQFYGKALRVLTNQNKLKLPKNYKAGLIWTDIVGEVEKVSTSGSICRKEIDAIVVEIKSLLIDREFQGSVGVVAPFRIQADRIRDAVSKEVPVSKLNTAGFLCSTADGFQGDERDIILISCVYQPNLYGGGMWYLTNTETRNLWNVAVSRARSALHIFGNKEFCKNSEAQHLSALAKQCDNPPEKITVHTGQFDSIWERKFYDALKVSGVDTISQFPLLGKRLDLAVPSVCLDIEVDGEKFHKDSSGRRKAEDLWRDMTIQAAGWTPMRFWVYELREDMDSCVLLVKNKICELEANLS
jgi:very-short-patch-repair endonuclease